LAARKGRPLDQLQLSVAASEKGDKQTKRKGEAAAAPTVEAEEEEGESHDTKSRRKGELVHEKTQTQAHITLLKKGIYFQTSSSVLPTSEKIIGAFDETVRACCLDQFGCSAVMHGEVITLNSNAMCRMNSAFFSGTPDALEQHGLLATFYMVTQGSVVLEFCRTSMSVLDHLHEMSGRLRDTFQGDKLLLFEKEINGWFSREAWPSRTQVLKLGDVFAVHGLLMHRLLLAEEELESQVCSVLVGLDGRELPLTSPTLRLEYPNMGPVVCGAEYKFAELCLLRYLYPFYGMAQLSCLEQQFEGSPTFQTLRTKLSLANATELEKGFFHCLTAFSESAKDFMGLEALRQLISGKFTKTMFSISTLLFWAKEIRQKFKRLLGGE
jgi:hypothetical protein